MVKWRVDPKYAMRPLLAFVPTGIGLLAVEGLLEGPRHWAGIVLAVISFVGAIRVIIGPENRWAWILSLAVSSTTLGAVVVLCVTLRPWLVMPTDMGQTYAGVALLLAVVWLTTMVSRPGPRRGVETRRRLVGWTVRVVVSGMAAAAVYGPPALLRLRLYDAVAEGDMATVSGVISWQGNGFTNDLGETPLHVAAAHGQDDMVRYLLNSKANVYAEDNRGHTALHAAALGGHVETVKALVAHRSPLHHMSRNGETPLYIAVSERNPEMVACLLELGASPKLEPRLLGSAVTVGDVRILVMLINAGASIERRDAKGRTALLLACQTGQFKMAEALIEAGARVEAQDSDGVTCLDWAVRNGHRDVVRLLTQHGGNEGRERGQM